MTQLLFLRAKTANTITYLKNALLNQKLPPEFTDFQEVAQHLKYYQTLYTRARYLIQNDQQVDPDLFKYSLDLFTVKQIDTFITHLLTKNIEQQKREFERMQTLLETIKSLDQELHKFYFNIYNQITLRYSVLSKVQTGTPQ